MAETTHQFRAETCKLLNILTHSLYTNHEIFLRELLSNASDALEKVRFLQATGGEVRDPELPLEIRIATDKENHILTIADTGVGMSEQDLIDNLGTIARSGSEQFLRERASEQGDAAKDAELVDDKLPGDDGEEPIVEHDDSKTDDAAQIIGRFGIGFYSVFMVAQRWKSPPFLLRATVRPMCGRPTAPALSPSVPSKVLRLRASNAAPA